MMRWMRVFAGTIIRCFTSCVVLGQSVSFDFASVKPSRLVVGHDGTISTDPVRLIARNATLKRLIFEAWRVPWSQIVGGA